MDDPTMFEEVGCEESIECQNAEVREELRSVAMPQCLTQEEFDASLNEIGVKFDNAG